MRFSGGRSKPPFFLLCPGGFSVWMNSPNGDQCARQTNERQDRGTQLLPGLPAPLQGCSSVGRGRPFPSPLGQPARAGGSSADVAILPVMDGSRLEPLFQFVPNLDSRFTHNSPCQGHKSLRTIRLKEWRGPRRRVQAVGRPQAGEQACGAGGAAQELHSDRLPPACLLPLQPAQSWLVPSQALSRLWGSFKRLLQFLWALTPQALRLSPTLP